MAEGFRVIPSIDLLGGDVVRLTQGDFDQAVSYGDPIRVVEQWQIPTNTLIHIVDLEASRRGSPQEIQAVSKLARLGYPTQVGGGVRSVEDAKLWIDAGASRVVAGTIAAEDPETLEKIVAAVGVDRVIPALDVNQGVVRVSGWESSSTRSVPMVLETLHAAGFTECLVTGISQDGTLRGPSFELYRDLRTMTPMKLIASGGVGVLNDIASLARLPNLSGAIVGKALQERLFTWGEAQTKAGSAREILPRIIPCLDVRDGRVVKGVNFEGLRDAGDPVESAMRYETEGADELVVLDVSATAEGRHASLETISRIAERLHIPLTVGGGVRDQEDFRALLRTGADRVSINTAAVENPQMIADLATEFGTQAIVCAIDAKRDGEGWKVHTHGGKNGTEIDAVQWAARCEALGAGELLVTSIDRDGTGGGFDLDLLRAISRRVRINIIASGGAGNKFDLQAAIEVGGAQGVLVASLFHDRQISIGEVKGYLQTVGIPMRR
jgi:imidazole glycerol-phosphate synthase subunit HisF